MKLYPECEAVLLSTMELLQESAHRITTPQQEQERNHIEEILAQLLQACRFHRRSVKMAQNLGHSINHMTPTSSSTITATRTHDRLVPLVKRLFEINSPEKHPHHSSPSSLISPPPLPPKSLIESSRFAQWIHTLRHDQVRKGVSPTYPYLCPSYHLPTSYLSHISVCLSTIHLVPGGFTHSRNSYRSNRSNRSNSDNSNNNNGNINNNYNYSNDSETRVRGTKNMGTRARGTHGWKRTLINALSKLRPYPLRA